MSFSSVYFLGKFTNIALRCFMFNNPFLVMLLSQFLVVLLAMSGNIFWEPESSID